MYEFNEKTHTHLLDGKRLHGVTTVLSIWGDAGALINWAANQAVDAIERGDSPEEARKAHIIKRDKAGDKGTEVHKQLEDALNLWIQEGHMIMNDDPVVQDVLNWMHEEYITPIKSEYNLYSRVHHYGGIADGLIEKDGKKYILDFKTSGTIQPKAFVQCGAYSVAIKELSDLDVAGVVVVHIPRGKSFKKDRNVYWRYDIKDLELTWLNVLQSYKMYKSLQNSTSKS